MLESREALLQRRGASSDAGQSLVSKTDAALERMMTDTSQTETRNKSPGYHKLVQVADSEPLASSRTAALRDFTGVDFAPHTSPQRRQGQSPRSPGSRMPPNNPATGIEGNEEYQQMIQVANQLLHAPKSECSDSDDDASRCEEEHHAGPQTKELSSTETFQHIAGAVIMLNTIVIGLEAAYIYDMQLKPYFMKVETVFTCLYVAELIIRLRDRGVKNYFIKDPDNAWNVFDFAITATGVLDTVMQFMGRGGGSGASAGRLFRVLRILRLFRALRFLKELDVVLALAAKATLKLLALVCLVVIVSAIVTTNILWDAPDATVAGEFGHLGASMWTMFKLMTLDGWITTVERVTHVKPQMLFFFIAFVFFASIALMSLVPAIFIELNITEREKAKAKEAHMRRKANSELKSKMLKHLFRIVDENYDGTASVKEMQRILDDAEMAKAFSHAGNVEDLMDMKLGVFMLLESKLEQYQHEDEWMASVTEPEFINGVNKAWGEVDQTMIRRGITQTRHRVHRMEHMIQEELGQVHQAILEIGSLGQRAASLEAQQKMMAEVCANAVRSEVEALRVGFEKRLSQALGGVKMGAPEPKDLDKEIKECMETRSSSPSPMGAMDLVQNLSQVVEAFGKIEEHAGKLVESVEKAVHSATQEGSAGQAPALPQPAAVNMKLERGMAGSLPGAIDDDPSEPAYAGQLAEALRAPATSTPSFVALVPVVGAVPPQVAGEHQEVRNLDPEITSHPPEEVRVLERPVSPAPTSATHGQPAVPIVAVVPSITGRALGAAPQRPPAAFREPSSRAFERTASRDPGAGPSSTAAQRNTSAPFQRTERRASTQSVQSMQSMQSMRGSGVSSSSSPRLRGTDDGGF